MNRAPYKYFDYYTFEDADIFFGREEETQKMIGEILSTRLLVLFSPSGSGKTSLINAGVRPELEKLGYQTVYVRLESKPIPSVQNAVTATLDSPVDEKNDDLYSFFETVTKKTKKPLVIFLDQFEEFFIVFRDKPEVRREFIQQAAKIKYDDQLPVFLVFSLREDYFANMHEFRDAIPSIFQNNANIRLESFSEDAARRAIAEPAKVVGLEYDDGLVETLVNDLKNSHPGIEPIRLQIVCHTLWQNKPKEATQITFSDYQSAGKADKILHRNVSRLLQSIPGRQHGLMVRIFAALKTPDNTKRYRAFDDLQEVLRRPSIFSGFFFFRAKHAVDLKRMLHKLTAVQVLRCEKRAGTNWYEFKHDYLVGEISKWMQWRKEKISKKRQIFGILPGIVLLLSLLSFLFYQFNTFYASFTKREYSQQMEEIKISRGKPFGDTHTTGYFRNVAKDYQADDELKAGLKLGFWKKSDWSHLADKLKLVDGGMFLYRIGQSQAGLDTLLAALKDEDSDVRAQAAGALGEIKTSDERMIAALLAALKDQDSYVRRQAAGALGKLLQPKPESELIQLVSHNLSGYRTAGARALAQKDSVEKIFDRVSQLREDPRPWVRLGAWEAYELIQTRIESEKAAQQLIQKADSLFKSGQLSAANNQYESAFEVLTDIIRVDSVQAAYTKFQQARCAVRQERKVSALDNLEIAFDYNPSLRDTLIAEMAKKDNDWTILRDNWYLRDVLLKK